MFSDYPAEAVNNALKGIELNKKNGNKCSTAVGKKKARDISNRKNLSLAELKKIFSYLSRAKTYYNKNDLSACGTISFLMWGGNPMLTYSRKKLNEQKKLNGFSNKFKMSSNRLKLGNYYYPDTRVLAHTITEIEPSGLEGGGDVVYFLDHNQGGDEMGIMLDTYKKYWINNLTGAGLIHEDQIFNKQKNNSMNGFSRAVVSPTEEMNGFSRMNYIIDGTTLNEGVEDMDDLDGYTLSGFTLNGRTARRIRRFYRKNAPWSYVGTAVLGLILVDVATGGKVRETLGMSKTKKKK